MHGSGIETVRIDDLPFWIRFIVCKIHHISEDGPKMVQTGTQGKNINIFCIGAGHTMGFLAIKVILRSDFSLQ